MGLSVTILILAYNEGKNLHKTVASCEDACKQVKADYELLVCDDGSSDDTHLVAQSIAKKNKRVSVMHNAQNVGAGRTFKKGIRVAKKDYVMWVPGDNEVVGDSIAKMLHVAPKYDLVCSIIGNPTIRPLYRQFISWGFTQIMNIMFCMRLKHFLGMILCKKELLLTRKIRNNSSSIWAEIIIGLIKTKHSYKQVPIVMRKKEMSMNIFRFRNVFGLVGSILDLFYRFMILREHKRY